MSATFVKYLTINDYLPTIQKGQLSQQILDSLYAGTLERQFAESWAIGQVRRYLKQVLDLDYEITPTLPFDTNKTYYGNSRVIIDFNAWVSKKSYLQFDCIIKDTVGYLCLQQNQDEVFDASKWQQIGNQYDLYFVPLPFPLFSLEVQKTKGNYTAGFYKVGDKVWWDNHNFTSLRQTSLLDHDTLIQYPAYSSIPQSNIFPNDPEMGSSYWTDNGEYSIDPKVEIPSYLIDGQTQIWKLGDNRDPLLVQAIIDLALWKLHSRISPNNIPDLRNKNRDLTFEWMKSIQKGESNTDIEVLQPSQGESFRWGSSPKNINGYS
jgi:hypothetical protein